MFGRHLGARVRLRRAEGGEEDRGQKRVLDDFKKYCKYHVFKYEVDYRMRDILHG